VERSGERLETLTRRMAGALAGQIRQRRHVLDGESKMLASLGYQSVLARGFALVRGPGGETVRSARAVAMGQLLDIELADGRVTADVTGVHRTDATPPERKPERAPATPPQRKTKGQGSLF
jgi:exodeoxyribonuclease VII large subunit